MVHSPQRQRSDALKVTVSLCLTYSVIFILIAAHLRHRSGSWRWDDAIAAVATVLSLGQYATQYVALHFGQGGSTATLVTSENLNSLNATNRAGVILFFLTLYASKLAAVALLYRFAPLKRHNHAILVTLVLFFLFCFVSLLALNVSCGLTGPLYWNMVRDSDKCPGQYARWVATTALDFASEIIILLLPIDMVWSLQMVVKSKLIVLGRFWLRIPVLVLAIGRFIYLRKLLSATDIGAASNLTTILQEVEMTTSLSATVILTLRPFAKEFDTGFGGGRETFAAYGYSNSNSKNNTLNSTGSTVASTGSRIASRFRRPSRKDSALPGRKDSGGVPLGDLQRRVTDEPSETTKSDRAQTSDSIRRTIDNKVEYEDRELPADRQRGKSDAKSVSAECLL